MRLRLLFAVVLLGCLAACGGGFTDPSQNRTETFTGTIQPGAGNVGTVHQFSASRNGELTITLTSLVPTYAGFLEVDYGQVGGGQCIPLQQNQFVRAGTQAVAGVIQTGSYCVYVVDEGGFTTAETYTLTVNHP